MGNSASADCQRYLDRYPGAPENPAARKNLDFYSGKISSAPEGAKIDVIHRDWWGDYHLLEVHHSYIQWLFPIREEGLNHMAQVLQQHEADAIAADTALQDKIITSYRMMLDFYGMRLVNPDKRDGELERADNWRQRYDHLDRSFHNMLRITRIFKCLGEVGLEAMKKPGIMFFLKEIFENGELQSATESAARFWANVLRDDAERAEVAAYVEKHMPKREDPYSRPYRGGGGRMGGGGGGGGGGAAHGAAFINLDDDDEDDYNPYDDDEFDPELDDDDDDDDIDDADDDPIDAELADAAPAPAAASDDGSTDAAAAAAAATSDDAQAASGGGAGDGGDDDVVGSGSPAAGTTPATGDMVAGGGGAGRAGPDDDDDDSEDETSMTEAGSCAEHGGESRDFSGTDPFP